MKILYHHRTRGQDVEGVHINSISEALISLGHDVTIMSFNKVYKYSLKHNKEQVLQKQYANKGGVITAITKNSPEFIFELLEILYNMYSFFRLNRFLKNNKVDFIYERYSLFHFVTCLVAKKHNVKLIIEVNDSALVPRVRPLLLKKIARKIENYFFHRVDGIVFISSFFKNIVENNYNLFSKNVISPNAADINKFDRNKFDKILLRKEFGFTKGDIVCGYVGAFVKWHGIDEFIYKCELLIRNNTHLKFLLIGDGTQLLPIQEFVEEKGLTNNVILTGRVDHNKVPELMACMDISILPNSNEYGSPMKVFELMSMGVPVLAPNYDPLKEVIEDKETGWLFQRGNYSDALEKLETLIHNIDEINEVSKKCESYVQKNRTWINNAKEIIGLID